MTASRLTSENFAKLATSEPVFVVMFVDGSDSRTTVILKRLSEVAGGFRTGIGFGSVDLALPGNDQLGFDQGVAIAPLLAFYCGGSAIDTEIVGYIKIMRELTRENLLATFGRTLSGTTLIH